MATVSSPLVGSAIIGARELVPDMPSVLAPPAGGSPAVSVVAATGSTLPTGNYLVMVTFRNQWGETLPSGESAAQTVIANTGIQVTGPAIPTGGTALRIYLTAPGGVAGTESQWVETNTLPFTISAPLTNAGFPPTRNTAWLPDTDGGFISASAIYRWLNNGLSFVTHEAGGYTDYSGVPSAAGQPLYTIAGEWNEITSIWYDGYWMSGGDRGLFFRRNTITSSVLAQATVSVVSNRMVLEVYPQPARTAVATTLANPMSATDSSATLTAVGFLLPFGFVQIDTEIMAYGGISGNTLTGLIRGLGGSPAVAHAATAPTNELNIFWSGRRQTTQLGGFNPGNSASVLPIPSGWEYLLINYIAGRAKIAEHDIQGMSALLGEIRQEIKEWARTSKGVATRRQIGGTGSPAVYFPTPAGGLIVP